MNSTPLKKFTFAGAVVAIAILLTAIVWWPLWNGGGFVGGDVYSYYFPQKVYFAEAIRANDFPLWNNRAGHGYPLVGESQTGPFYPPNLLLYRFFEVNTAYNVNHLLHYAAAFVFAWLFARAVGLGNLAAGLAAFTYSYGWFPARSCWEWAIIGGAWLPAILWCCERFLATRLWRWVIAMAAFVGLQLMAGHFNLAFMTQATVVLWLAARLSFDRGSIPQATIAKRGRAAALVLAALFCGFLLAAAQLLPTWELKQNSQRSAPGENHNLAHGSIPLWYWQQTIFPWRWYDIEFNRDAALGESTASLGAPTNQVEAHLYFGIVPLALALLELLQAVRTRDRERLLWGAIGIATLLYTSGMLLPVFQFVPGFSFFQGPGRWGVVTTLMVGLLAGSALDRLRRAPSLPAGLWVAAAMGLAMWSTLTLGVRKLQSASFSGMSNPLKFGPLSITDGFLTGLTVFVVLGAIVAVLLLKLQSGSKGSSPFPGRLMTACILIATLFDLWLVSGLVKYSEIVPNPPISRLADSPIREILSRYGGTARLYAPGANLPTVLGSASTPVYLTFGPAAYVDPELKMPEKPSAEQTAWLRRSGVTHILSFDPMRATEQMPVVPVWQGFDPVLNPAMARREPFYLYELRGTRGRAAWSDDVAQGTIRITEFRADDVALDVDSPTGGRVVLTDLIYPGWKATIDGEPAEIVAVDRMFRAVDVPAGRHSVVWTYRPPHVYWGAAVGFFAFLLLAAIAHIRFWHPARLAFLDEASKI
ncbi:MAG: YfhO family protein [Planctomycetaceae bacterium]